MSFGRGDAGRTGTNRNVVDGGDCADIDNPCRSVELVLVAFDEPMCLTRPCGQSRCGPC